MKASSSKIDQLIARKHSILSELAELGPMRRGTVHQQYVEASLRDGSKVRRGPYPLYTYKENNKTISRRLTDANEARLYQEQTESCRRFDALMSQWISLQEQLSEVEMKDPSALKKRPLLSWNKKMK